MIAPPGWNPGPAPGSAGSRQPGRQADPAHQLTALISEASAAAKPDSPTPLAPRFEKRTRRHFMSDREVGQVSGPPQQILFKAIA